MRLAFYFWSVAHGFASILVDGAMPPGLEDLDVASYAGSVFDVATREPESSSTGATISGRKEAALASSTWTQPTRRTEGEAHRQHDNAEASSPFAGRASSAVEQ